MSEWKLAKSEVNIRDVIVRSTNEAEIGKIEIVEIRKKKPKKKTRKSS